MQQQDKAGDHSIVFGVELDGKTLGEHLSKAKPVEGQVYIVSTTGASPAVYCPVSPSVPPPLCPSLPPSLSLVLLATMQSMEFKTKIYSHAHSLILFLLFAFPLLSPTFSDSLSQPVSAGSSTTLLASTELDVGIRLQSSSSVVDPASVGGLTGASASSLLSTLSTFDNLWDQSESVSTALVSHCCCAHLSRCS